MVPLGSKVKVSTIGQSTEQTLHVKGESKYVDDIPFFLKNSMFNSCIAISMLYDMIHATIWTKSSHHADI